jgi:hypothetical protein
VLAYVLAQSLRGDVETIRSREPGRFKQREILRMLEVPASNAMVKLLRKIQPQSVTGENWRRLLSVLGSADGNIRRRISHLERINTRVLEILLDRSLAEACGSGLLEDVATDGRESYRPSMARLVSETLRMQEQLQPRRPVRRFLDTQHLQAVHESIAEDYRRHLERMRQARRYARENFQRPPVPGVEGKILPLNNPELLIEEGEEQGNCVASYADSVERGDTCIYRLLEPERATLSVVRDSDGCWCIGELQARFNEEVRPATWRSVEEWLDRYRISV